MDSAFKHGDHEQKLYEMWEKSGAFQPHGDSKKSTYSILLPPPNANASLHAGHAMFVVEDILIRWKRMQGHPTVWVPGTDHAGYETQYVYEKQLAKQGSSRFKFDRQTFYNNVDQFVRDNSGLIETQLKQLGFSLDWTRNTFMLDDKVIKIVYDTFHKMVNDGLIYRDNYIVNYCPKCGTTFADLEVNHIERTDPLYYMKYGPFTIATVRPETKFRDTALAANPSDSRYKKWIGKEVEVMGLLGPVKMKVIADPDVDPTFGTGIMKVTPAHDPHDFVLGRKHNLPVVSIIDTRGKMDFSWYLAEHDESNTDPKYLERAKNYHGKSVKEMRAIMEKDLAEDGLLEKVDRNYNHTVVVCYKSGHDIEPLVLPNWFVKIRPLAEPAIKAAKDGKVKFVPARFEKQYYQWLEKFIDWPISRQVVWGVRIPVWYDTKKYPNIEVTFLDPVTNERKSGTIKAITGMGDDLKPRSSLGVDKVVVSSFPGSTVEQIRNGLQQLRAPIDAKYVVSDDSPGPDYLPETDTFDTWFSSGQWPLTTLGFPDNKDFKAFYPTAVLDTMWDILFFWVARMIMFGIYRTGEVPFRTVYLHSMVTDEKGQKMSKSKGNVINPIDISNEFGADALRISLVAGSTPGNPIALSKEKVKGYRNFANKLWNIGRFIVLLKEQQGTFVPHVPTKKLEKKHADIIKKKILLVRSVTKSLEKYRFSDAALGLYDFVWNKFANEYLEHSKNDEDKALVLSVLVEVYTTCLKLLHPFMPYVTEAIWQEFLKARLVEEKMLVTAEWPKH